MPPGESLATKEQALADRLVATRLDELETVRRAAALTGIRSKSTLEHMVAQHLRRRRKQAVSEGLVASNERHLRAAVEHFGPGREVASITAKDVKRWLRWLQKHRRGRGQSGLSDGSLRHYLNSLSNLFRAASDAGSVPAGYNPCSAVVQKPAGEPKGEVWLENRDAALLLEAARTYEPDRAEGAITYAYPLVAAFLLTGGRRLEVLGLDASDIDFEASEVRFRTNRWRPIHGAHADRVVPLWPQLALILGAYVQDQGGEGLLFPTPRGRKAKMLVGIEAILDRMAERAGWTTGLRAGVLRNTYCAERLHTVEQGQPVALGKVAAEVGYAGLGMVQRVSTSIGDPRRTEVVEYDVERYPELLERLAALRVGWVLE